MFAGEVRVRSAAVFALRALGHGERVLFETPLPLDRSEPGDLLGAARAALLAAASGTLSRYAAELREAASEALRGDDAGRAAVLSFLASETPATPPLAAGGAHGKFRSAGNLWRPATPL